MRMRLIDADELKQAIPETKVDVFENCGSCTCLTDEQVKELIDEAPTIEALKEQQPKKGQWIISNQTNIYGATKVTCSNCNDSVMVQYIQDELFCRHCGADMRTVVDR